MALDRQVRATPFGAAADASDRARPTYPDATVDWLIGPNARRVLDLGAGTGKLTRSLVARGFETVAVDPSAEMLARLREMSPEVESLIGTAEAIPLPDRCVDAVVVGQARHWVDPRKAAPEIARVLRPGGALGIVWNVRDDAVVWVADLNRIIDGGSPDPTFTGPPVVGHPFGPTERLASRWDYKLDAGGLIDLAHSRSKTIMLPQVERVALVAELRAFFAKHAKGGALTIPYVTHGFRARLSP
jgi:SAM-dependent methyltransferase